MLSHYAIQRKGLGLVIAIRTRYLFALAVAGVLLSAPLISAEGLREWKGAKGVTVKASFVNVKDGFVFLKLESGDVVQALIENLCKEDQAFILESAREEREVEVAYVCEGIGHYQESGVSPAAMVRDTITFRISEVQLDKSFKATGDSRWLLKKVEFVAKEMAVVDTALGDEPLTTEGQFVVINYTVENDSPIPITPPPPLLVDQRDRKYLPLDNYRVAPFLSEGVLQPEKDIVQPGFKKQFCSIYEVSLTCEVVAVEIFPVKVPGFSVRQFKVNGKRINLKMVAPEQEDAADKALQAAAPAGFNVFMKCIRLGQGGNTAGYYYDYSKKRSLAYGVELRTTSKRAETLAVKAFFIGQIQGGKTLWLIGSRWMSRSIQAGSSGSRYSQRKSRRATIITTTVHHQPGAVPSWKVLLFKCGREMKF